MALLISFVIYPTRYNKKMTWEKKKKDQNRRTSCLVPAGSTDATIGMKLTTIRQPVPYGRQSDGHRD